MSIVNADNRELAHFSVFNGKVRFIANKFMFDLCEIKITKPWFDGMIIYNLGDVTKLFIQAADCSKIPLTFENFSALVQYHLVSTEKFRQPNESEDERTAKIEAERTAKIEAKFIARKKLLNQEIKFHNSENTIKSGIGEVTYDGKRGMYVLVLIRLDNGYHLFTECKMDNSNTSCKMGILKTTNTAEEMIAYLDACKKDNLIYLEYPILGIPRAQFDISNAVDIFLFQKYLIHTLASQKSLIDVLSSLF